jgi:hypothetical protein
MEIDPKGGRGPQTRAALHDLGGASLALVAGFGATD